MNTCTKPAIEEKTAKDRITISAPKFKNILIICKIYKHLLTIKK